ncbi:uncharacterized protein TNCV_679581 [Trichonephila clavipes]|nr:uncharacterized protein TNCV_679581 [Trichonephila clavipes]
MSRGDTKRALIESNEENPCCLGRYTNMFERNNVSTLSESSEFLHVAHSLNSATIFSGKVLLSRGKCFSFVGFNEPKNQRSHLCPNGLLIIVVVKCVVAATQCVLINGDSTQSMPKQSGVNIVAISSSACIISTASAADVLTPSVIYLVAFILLCSRHCLIPSCGVLMAPLDCS